MSRKVWIFLIAILIVGGYVIIFNILGVVDNKTEKLMIDLNNYTLKQIEDYANNNDLVLEIKFTHHSDISEGEIISQGIEEGSIINKNDTLVVVISLGKIPVDLYNEYKINELGLVPVMMYHDIVNIDNAATPYTGGNVDKDGYNRTTEAFRSDLEMYYQKGYRMIRLKDYIEGHIDTEFGKSPIVLTFDDGNKGNIRIMGRDDKGNLIIDPNSAVGILEDFKYKYPDFNVTATFFLNEGLFQQPEYDEEIIKWLVDNDYDIGNHTKGHIDFSKVDEIDTQYSIAYMYQKLDKIIPNQYQKIIALPFGSPYKREHPIFPYILKGEHEGYQYETKATLRVGWEANLSPYHKDFDKKFVKRIRAWDNNGQHFDIEMCFEMLETSRYISDGESDTVVIANDKDLNISIDKKIIKY